MAKNSPAAIKQLINYFYLLSFCPPDYVGELKKASQPMRRTLWAGQGSCAGTGYPRSSHAHRRLSASHPPAREFCRAGTG